MEKTEPKKAEKPRVEKNEIKPDVTPIVESAPFATEGRSTAEEMKNMAKRESGSTAAKKSVTPAVSYPYYPGGNIAIREWVRKNQQYPPECKRERLRGRVEVMIAIAPDGTPHSATISKSSGNVHMDAEALRIADLMPKWTPAVESDDPQGIDYVIFVNFRPGR
jgi:protein TonB